MNNQDKARECAEEALIKHMVDRFLGWQLPESFSPDNGISFKPTFNDHLPVPMKCNPTGTNLFDAQQAEAMVRYMLEGLYFPPSVPVQSVYAAIDAEEELSDEPPKGMQDWLEHATPDEIIEAMRIAVRQTKDGIRNRVRALIAEAENANSNHA